MATFRNKWYLKESCHSNDSIQNSEIWNLLYFIPSIRTFSIMVINNSSTNFFQNLWDGMRPASEFWLWIAKRDPVIALSLSVPVAPPAAERPITWSGNACHQFASWVFITCNTVPLSKGMPNSLHGTYSSSSGSKSNNARTWSWNNIKEHFNNS